MPGGLDVATGDTQTLTAVEANARCAVTLVYGQQLVVMPLVAGV